MAEECREESSLASLTAEELEQRLEEAVGKRETLQVNETFVVPVISTPEAPID